MKLVEAIIKPIKLDDVKAALRNIGIDEFMESVLICHGRKKGQMMLFRGSEYMLNFVEKIKLEIIAADDTVGKIVEAIGTTARTERQDDCRIYILPFVEAA